MEWIVAIPHLLSSGVGNLASYLAAHVLLCLLPAFYIAGAMTALIPKPVKPDSWGVIAHATSPIPLPRWLGQFWPSALAP